MRLLSRLRKHVPEDWLKHSSKNLRRAVIIVGAGASKVLGLPLQSELFSYLRRKNKQEAHHLEYTEDEFGSDVERAFTLLEAEARDSHVLSWSDANLRLSILKNTISECFAKQIVDRDGWVLYKEFLLTILSLYETVSIISLNWDTSLEELLIESGKGIDYGILFDSTDHGWPNRSETVPVYKLHGSLNWWLCHNCKEFFCSNVMPEQASSLGLQTIFRDKGAHQKAEKLWRQRWWDKKVRIRIDDNQIIRLMPPVTLNVCPQCSIPALEVVITPPSVFKQTLVNYQDSVRRRAHHALAAAGNIFIVGSSLREADYDLMHLLKGTVLKGGVFSLGVVNDLPAAQKTLGLLKRRMGARLECMAFHLGYLDKDTSMNVRRMHKYINDRI